MSSPFVAEAPGGPGDVDRMEALEQQVRQLTSRLAGWVETQLVHALEDRRDDLQALRSEVQGILDEQLAGIRAETTSALSAATRRLEVGQEELGGRVEGVDERSTSETERLESIEAQVAALASGGDALDQRVRSAITRLSESVEARLAEVERARHSDADPAGAAELEQRAQAVVARLTQSVESRSTETADSLVAMQRSLDSAMARGDALERWAKAAAARVDGLLDARLAELSSSQQAALEQVRAESAAAAASIGERVDAVGLRVAAIADDVAAAYAEGQAGATRTAELEQRVKAAVGRLAESVEERLAEQAQAHAAEIASLGGTLRAGAGRPDQWRAEVDAATAALRSRFGPVHERLDALEQKQKDAGSDLSGLVDARLAGVVEQRRVEFEALRRDLEDSTASQLRDGRAEIASVVAEAHRRFLVSVDQLSERMNRVDEQATAAWAAVAGIETMQETVTSDGLRIEALELHSRRTAARLGDVIADKLAEEAPGRRAELDAIRGEVRAVAESVPAKIATAITGLRGNLRAALDAHLVETRTEVTRALSEGRADLATRTARLEDVGGEIEAARKDAEARLDEALTLRLAQIEAVAAQVALDRQATEAAVSSLTRRVTSAQDRMQHTVDTLVERVEALAQSATREAGPLAPLRSDVRQLKGEVAALAEAVADQAARRRAPAAKAPAKALAPAPPATPAKKAATRKAATTKAAVKKAPATRRRTSQ